MKFDTLLIIKIVLMVALFFEVVVFGNLVSRLTCFKNKLVMDLALTFSGALFLSISLLDITPQAISHFDSYYHQNEDAISDFPLEHAKVPLTTIIGSATYLLIMLIDKVLIGHPQDEDHLNIKQATDPSNPHNNQMQDYQTQKSQQGEGLPEKKIVQNVEINVQTNVIDHQRQNKQKGKDWGPLILQVGMSIHSFFQTLALGLQQTVLRLMGLAIAILVHKWAEGLTLGLMYKKGGYSARTTFLALLFQGGVNIVGFTIGCVLSGQGNLVMAIFMSMSAGTFFYISLGQVLPQQLGKITRQKWIMMLVANVFIGAVVFFQQWQEKRSESS